MKSYSAGVFTVREQKLLKVATELVARIPDQEGLRCHEIARAVGHVLGLEVQDGRFGAMEHSWLWTEPIVRYVGAGRYPNILDCYAVGALPQVVLIQMGYLLPWNQAYHPYAVGEMRDDINAELVQRLLFQMDRPGHEPLAVPSRPPLRETEKGSCRS